MAAAETHSRIGLSISIDDSGMVKMERKPYIFSLYRENGRLLHDQAFGNHAVTMTGLFEAISISGVAYVQLQMPDGSPIVGTPDVVRKQIE